MIKTTDVSNHLDTQSHADTEPFNRTGRLRELDGWRAVSVLLVIVHHVLAFQHRGLTSHFPALLHVAEFCGPMGVNVFFVISGFVICRLLILEEASFGRVSLKAFYYRRVFRILPPLYCFLGVLSLLACLGLIHLSVRAILGAAIFAFDLGQGPVHLGQIYLGTIDLGRDLWLVGHTWSLAVEEQFYLIFPGMLVLTPKRFRSKMFLLAFLSCSVWNLWTAFSGSEGLMSSKTRAGFACIAFGVLMAMNERRVRAVARRVPGFLVALVALVLLIHPEHSYSWKALLYESLFVPVAIGLLLSFSLESKGWLRAFLCSKPVQALGITSYGIYLWQQLFTAPGEFFAGAGKIIPMLLPMLFLVVPLSYFLIEVPAMRYGKALSRQTRGNAIEADVKCGAEVAT